MGEAAIKALSDGDLRRAYEVRALKADNPDMKKMQKRIQKRDEERRIITGFSSANQREFSVRQAVSDDPDEIPEVTIRSISKKGW